MKLIIGLGNPGKGYQNNRHNTGHIFVNSLLQKNLPQGLIVKKSSVYMNDSGQEIRGLVDKYRIDLENLYIVHDDLDIPLGSFKIQKGKGPKEHNGLESIEDCLNSTDFWRVRIGIDNRKEGERVEGKEYVLEDFSKQERIILDDIIKKAARELLKVIKNG